MVAAGLAGWWFWPQAAAPVPPATVVDAEISPPPQALALPLDTTPARQPAAAPPTVPLLDEAAIAAHRADRPVLLRLAENPRIFVLDFPDLASQGAALNRVAAFVEKAGTPRDRVLTEAEMQVVLARQGERADHYYYGHDYRGSDLARFFAFAARDGVALTAGEAWVAEQLRLAQQWERTGEVALISIVAPGGDVDTAARRTTLRHEIGHGHDFTLPFYGAHVRRTWHEALTEQERAAFRTFLGREGYDTGNDDLMAAEMQAYLLFTPDRRFFSPDMAGLSEDKAEDLRDMLRDRATFDGGLPIDPS